MADRVSMGWDGSNTTVFAMYPSCSLLTANGPCHQLNTQDAKIISSGSVVKKVSSVRLVTSQLNPQ
jgi:hypothetical protein